MTKKGALAPFFLASLLFRPVTHHALTIYLTSTLDKKLAKAFNFVFESGYFQGGLSS